MMIELHPIDVRLKPQAAMATDATRHPTEYAISDDSHPEVAAALQEMQQEMGLQGYRIAILGDNFGGAGLDWDRKVIGIGVRKWNAQSFEEIKALIGHELGHAYRHEHPRTQPLGPQIAGLDAKRMEEIEADRFSVCLAGREATIANLRHGGVAMDEDLSNELRIGAVEQFSPESCAAASSARASGKRSL